MNTEDKIKDLFSEQLGGLESPVRPELWNAISSQIATAGATSAAASGLSVAAKSLISASIIGAIGVASYFIVNANERSDAKVESKKETSLAIDQNKTEVNQDELVEANNSTHTHQDNITNSNQISSPELPTIAYENSQREESSTIGVSERAALPNLVTLLPHKTSEEYGNTAHTKENEIVQTNQSTDSKDVQKHQDLKEVTDIVQPTTVVATNSDKFEVTRLPNKFVNDPSRPFIISFKGKAADFQFTLMDKNNSVIYTSDQPNFRWDGTDKFGNKVPAGDYFYFIVGTDVNGTPFKAASSLNIQD